MAAGPYGTEEIQRKWLQMLMAEFKCHDSCLSCCFGPSAFSVFEVESDCVNFTHKSCFYHFLTQQFSCTMTILKVSMFFTLIRPWLKMRFHKTNQESDFRWWKRHYNCKAQRSEQMSNNLLWLCSQYKTDSVLDNFSIHLHKIILKSI